MKKTECSLKMCIDYRQRNKVTIKNKYPLLRISDFFYMLQGSTYFLKVDLKSRFHWLTVRECDLPKTKFRTYYGHFELLVLSFCLTNVPAAFVHLMNRVLKPYLDILAIVCIQEILVYSRNVEDHARHIRIVHRTLKNM